MTSSFLATPKKILQPEKPRGVPDPGIYWNGIENYYLKHKNGANKTNLV